MTACPRPKEEMFAKIVTRDRERPICAILLDPGIRPALMDPAPWDELRRAVTFYSGNPTDSAGRAETDYRSGL